MFQLYIQNKRIGETEGHSPKMRSSGRVMLLRVKYFKRYAKDKLIIAIKALSTLVAWASEGPMTND